VPELTDLDECISEVAEEIEVCYEGRVVCSVAMLQRALNHLRRLEDIDNETQ